MKFYRIGEKLISMDKVERTINKIFLLRSSGLSQQEVAQNIGSDRTFISRLETLGEIRRGGSLAVIGFPLSNVEELKEVCDLYGIEYVLLMTDRERWDLVQSKSGQDLLDWLMNLMFELQDYDNVIMIGSDMRIRLAEAILGEKVYGLQIGDSPIKSDVNLDPQKLMELVTSVKGDVR